MTPVAESRHARLHRRERMAHASAAPSTSDLPVLALEENPRHIPAWDELLAQGVEPALVLGAERRYRGPR